MKATRPGSYISTNYGNKVLFCGAFSAQPPPSPLSHDKDLDRQDGKKADDGGDRPFCPNDKSEGARRRNKMKKKKSYETRRGEAQSQATAKEPGIYVAFVMKICRCYLECVIQSMLLLIAYVTLKSTLLMVTSG